MTPTDEERRRFKEGELEAAKAIMAGARYCPDPSAHVGAAPSGQGEPPLSRVVVSNALDEAWLESHDARDVARPPDLAEHLYSALMEYVAIEREGYETNVEESQRYETGPSVTSGEPSNG